MAIKWRSRLVLAKIESVYGTDPTPAAATDAIEALEAEITPVAGDTEDLDLVRPHLGARPAIPVNTHVTIEFGVPLAGAGAAGDVPGWGVLMRACGFAETIAAGVDVAYDPVSADEESITMYFFVGDNLHKATGVRGGVSGLSFPANVLPRVNFAFVGLYEGPVEQAPGTPDFTIGFTTPLAVNQANTSGSVHGHSGAIESVELEFGQEVEHRDLINVKRVDIVDRVITGTIVLEAPLISTIDFFTKVVDATTGALSITHGTTAGRIVEVTAPKVQLVEPTYSESAGVAMLEAGLRLLPDTGDDDIKIVAK